jgi:hypothetical protein
MTACLAIVINMTTSHTKPVLRGPASWSCASLHLFYRWLMGSPSSGLADCCHTAIPGLFADRALLREDGSAPKAGQLWCNPDLASTYRRVGELGAVKGNKVAVSR